MNAREWAEVFEAGHEAMVDARVGVSASVALALALDAMKQKALEIHVLHLTPGGDGLNEIERLRRLGVGGQEGT